MKRDRALSRARWQAVADAEFNPETLLWVANVAARILAADAESSEKERAGAVLRAAGLEGRLDIQRAAIRTVVADADFVCELIARDRELRRGERTSIRREMVARTFGIEETPAAIDKRIRRALAN